MLDQEAAVVIGKKPLTLDTPAYSAEGEFSSLAHQSGFGTLVYEVWADWLKLGAEDRRDRPVWTLRRPRDHRA